jgi:hypothetical protein
MAKHLTTKLAHGHRKGKLISIDEVESGLKCESHCLKCQAPLVAKKGTKKEHHFAHYRVAECAGAQMTALHMRIEMLIAKHGYMTFPNVLCSNGEILRAKETICFERGSVVVEDSSFLSKWHIKPDVSAVVNGSTYLIEIAVTHLVDDDKLRKLIELGLPTLEVRLSVEEHGNFSDTELESFILDTHLCKNWLVHPARAKQEFELKKQRQKAREVQARRETKYLKQGILAFWLFIVGRELWRRAKL